MGFLKKCVSFVIKCLSCLSAGKFRSGLYYDNQTYYSSPISGLFSLLAGIFLLIYSSIILIGTFERSQYNISIKQDIISLDDYPQTISQLNDYLNLTLIIHQNFPNDYRLDCNNPNLTIVFLYEDDMISEEDLQTIRYHKECDFIRNEDVRLGILFVKFKVYSDLKIKGNAYYSVKIFIHNKEDYILKNIYFYYHTDMYLYTGDQLKITRVNSTIYPGFDNEIYNQFFLVKKTNQIAKLWYQDYEFESQVYPQCDGSTQKLLPFYENSDLKLQVYQLLARIYYVDEGVVITKIPRTLFESLSQIGGMLVFFKVVSLIQEKLNQHLFEKKLQRRFETFELSLLSEQNEIKNKRYNMKEIKQKFSYDQHFQDHLEIQELKKQVQKLLEEKQRDLVQINRSQINFNNSRGNDYHSESEDDDSISLSGSRQ
ncbi:UNKNOWN [Stylonychia lemnae]|uniref:Transmembrane protein n=1 Tax=Stylonychia lemnae TaxID=5949 RepID=A0A078B1K4_STYLE|nr:UNKNOWN [Stylonychia lemnae]|eukprot:CDW88445.1 UNKNOWN [Stylonychia lemnae]